MSRDDAQKLLGGYATGTLTADEQAALFEAALQDQELFDALAREQALRELLGDPAARAQVLAAIDDAPAPWYRRWWRPVPVAALATALALIALVAVRQSARAPRPLRMAKLDLSTVRRPEPVAPLPPPPDVMPAAPPAMAPFSLPGVVPPVPAPPTAEAKAKKVESITVTDAAPMAVPPPAPPASPAAGAISGATPVPGGLMALRTASAMGAAQPNAQALFYGTGPAAYSMGALRNGFAQLDGQQQAQAGAQSSQATPAANVAIQYRVLRKAAEGDFVDLDATGRVPAGSSVKLEITPNDNGYMRITESGVDGARRELMNRPVERMRPLETDTWQYPDPGMKELQVVFSRKPFETPPVVPMVEDVTRMTVDASAPAGIAGAPGGAAGGRGGRGGGGGARPRFNYAANRDPAGPQVSVAITLNIQ